MKAASRIILLIAAETLLAKGPSALYQKMAKNLFADPDYHIFICGEDSCSLEDFQSKLEFLPVQLRIKPRPVSGYIVTPARLATNYYSSFFIVQNQIPTLQFTYFGCNLGLDKQSDAKGFRYLEGTERIDLLQHSQTIFGWNGKGYGPISDKEKLNRRLNGAADHNLEPDTLTFTTKVLAPSIWQKMDSVAPGRIQPIKSALIDWHDFPIWLTLQSSKDSTGISKCTAVEWNSRNVKIKWAKSNCEVEGGPQYFPVKGTKFPAVYWKVKVQDSGESAQVRRFMAWFPSPVSGEFCSSKILDSAITDEIHTRNNPKLSFELLENDLVCITP